MPFIHVRSLPIDGFDPADVVTDLSRDFAEAVDVDVEHVTVTWTIIPPGCYAAAGRNPDSQPETDHPVLGDLLAPDFNTAEDVREMLEAVAAGIERRAGIAKENVFICYRAAASGMVYDGGEIVTW